jgi:hypothetical protein
MQLKLFQIRNRPRGQRKIRQPFRRSGSVLIEFALIALILYLLLAAVIEFGRAFYSAQAVQSAADVAARELARVPLPADISLTKALDDPVVRSKVFDPRLLVIDLDNLEIDGTPAVGTDDAAKLDYVYARMPIVNQALRPLMIFEAFDGRNLLRYPGQLQTKGPETGLPPPRFETGLRVVVYQILSVGANGAETIKPVPVLEEVDAGSDPSLFSVRNPNSRGVVALRINFPYQAAALSGFRDTDPTTLGPDKPLDPVIADDSAVTVQTNPNYMPDGAAAEGANPADDASLRPYKGQYGLGQQAAFAGKTIRPFSKLLSGQAVYRREVLE